MAEQEKLLFSVSHDCFVTDHIGRTASIVEATSPGMAVRIFNKLAATRREYPYCWSDGHSVDCVKVIKES